MNAKTIFIETTRVSQLGSGLIKKIKSLLKRPLKAEQRALQSSETFNKSPRDIIKLSKLT